MSKVKTVNIETGKITEHNATQAENTAFAQAQEKVTEYFLSVEQERETKKFINALRDALMFDGVKTFDDLVERLKSELKGDNHGIR